MNPLWAISLLAYLARDTWTISLGLEPHFLLHLLVLPQDISQFVSLTFAEGCPGRSPLKALATVIQAHPSLLGSLCSSIFCVLLVGISFREHSISESRDLEVFRECLV